MTSPVQQASSGYRLAALLLGVSALLHLAAPIFGGFSGTGLMLLPIFILYAAMAYGLSIGWRWLAWITFFVTAIGGMVAMSYLWSFDPVPTWVFAGILAADWACMVVLFGVLWRSPTRQVAL